MRAEEEKREGGEKGGKMNNNRVRTLGISLEGRRFQFR